MNRIERISAILIQLQSKKIVKAQEIADRFEISLRTVYRDIRSLEASGVPIIGEAGVGFSLIDGYKLPPIMFSKEEAIALITAEKLIQKYTDQSTQKTYESALYKIKSVLKGPEKEKLNELNENIVAVQNQYLPTNNSTGHIQSILKSISEKVSIEINYFTNYTQENSTRIVEPIGIFHKVNNWYLIAFCTKRNDYRNFKIERITQLEILPNTIKTKHPPLKTFLESHLETKDLTQIRIVVNKMILRFLGDEKYYQGFVSMKELSNEKFEITFLSASLHGFCVWFIQFADYGDIIEPLELKTLFKKRISALAEKYL